MTKASGINPRGPIERGPTAHQVAANLRRLRVPLSMAQLVTRAAKLGRTISIDSLSSIELGRRRVDVDDLMVLAQALGVSPLALLLPCPDEPSASVELTGTGTVTAAAAWAWAEGSHPLVLSAADPAGDAIRYRLDSRPAWARGQQ
jgi:transcriptional regulator with XRE-family HTH domain